jgi:uncharacterized protein with von Willebrand factor type A (vWA) domain
MLPRLLLHLRAHGLPIGVGEYLSLLGALKAGLADADVERFHSLARTCLVKDEVHYDRFDQAFGAWLNGQQGLGADLLRQLPEDWLKLAMQREFSAEERAAIEAMGGLEELMETLRQRLAEQTERHEGGNRWIGTGGTSPFGHGGYNPLGVRIGGAGGKGRATKVWERREYADLDDRRELGTRNFRLALRKLRRFAREGAPEVLDIDATINGTARNAGWLDLNFRPERRNAIKVLLLLDIGGSMDPFVRLSETLFSAARAEFKHLEPYYFHNCVYDRVWKHAELRGADAVPTAELLHRYNSDWRLIIVGDAAMSPYELVSAGGAIDHVNPVSGEEWLHKLFQTWRRVAWLNPMAEGDWDYISTVRHIRQLLGDRMYPLSPEGLARAVNRLKA